MIETASRIPIKGLEHERAETLLRESEQRFRRLADTAPIMIWMSGPDKLCTYFNKHWLAFTGQTLEHELGNGWSEGVHPDDLPRCLEIYHRSFDRRQEFQMEYRLRRFDGEYRWIVDRGVPRATVGGPLEGYIDSCVDITEQKRAELDVYQLRRELAHMARVATLGELTASLVHELTQPLTAILSNAQAAQRLLALGPSSLDEVKEILRDIGEDDNRAMEVIRRLRGLLKKEEGERKPVQLNKLVQQIVQLVRHDAAMRQSALEVDLDPALRPILGDPVQLQQVLLNLLLNGLDAMAGLAPWERRLLVRTRRRDTRTVEVAVSDRGAGIPADRLGKVFEPFFTTKPHGIGMGLAICRSIITAHGGGIAATNNPDRGATLCFTLPVEGPP
jgi:PAS domain S-box-containing protein